MITVHESNTNSSKNTFQSSQQNTTVLLVSAACERAWTIPISNSIKRVAPTRYKILTFSNDKNHYANISTTNKILKEYHHPN